METERTKKGPPTLDLPDSLILVPGLGRGSNRWLAINLSLPEDLGDAIEAMNWTCGHDSMRWRHLKPHSFQIWTPRDVVQSIAKRTHATIAVARIRETPAPELGFSGHEFLENRRILIRRKKGSKSDCVPFVAVGFEFKFPADEIEEKRVRVRKPVFWP
ncbi:hypothetical protein SISNIDRAFT_463022 [Sistotremastrum niveocremeum HHB9708]|uniref:Uncharacterized protein n=1 Tax=Sistotremastrum niveocremeum HHB9708 TaxID=1314777 RepID=A0A164YMQ8_9AGAM|nr:hypothetical protein SISNIDRAFT_463022 [Sistotremastrum niveocremeum HHB9708]